MIPSCEKTVTKAGKMLVAVVCTISFICSPGMAQEEENDFEPGFSGYIQPMVGVGVSKSISDVGDDNKRIDSLDQKAESETDFVPMLLWGLGYTFKNESTMLYVGTPEENIIEGSFLLEAGIRQKLPGGTVLTFAYIPELPLLDDEVWKDPFLLGSDRQETDRDSQAFSIMADSIFGSPLTLKYGFGKQEIDDDQSGTYLSRQAGSTLTAQDLLTLKRGGNFHQVDAMYTFTLENGATIQPGINYLRGNADGEANSFDSFGGQITATYPVGQWHFFGTISLNGSEYDKTHPVFKKTREQWKYDAILGMGYMAPFGWEDFMVNLYTGFSSQDSNIGFYDTSGMMTGVGLTWMF